LGRFRTVCHVVKPDGERLVELAWLADRGKLRPMIDAVFPPE
jgi:hypothetical protein